ncbi:hypothetical protein ACWDOR_23465 [Streptosporangium canum]|uniref:hypothetical protein n=1 Tax=Streptosporangium canum TaxID=324952 RepID=UPI0036C75DFE
MVAVQVYVVFALFLLSRAGLVSIIGEPLLTIGLLAHATRTVSVGTVCPEPHPSDLVPSLPDRLVTFQPSTTPNTHPLSPTMKITNSIPSVKRVRGGAPESACPLLAILWHVEPGTAPHHEPTGRRRP